MNANIKIKRLKNLNSILHRQGEFSALVSKANKLEYLNNMLQSKLDQELSMHCKIGDWSMLSNSMTLLTDSAAWQYRIRFDLNKILQHIQQIPGFSRIATLNLQVDPNISRNTKKPKPLLTSDNAVSIDKESREILTDIVDTTRSENLKNALKHLLAQN